MRQIQNLAEEMDTDANKNRDAWHKLLEFDEPKSKLVALTDPSKGVRQDNIPNGIISEFDKKSLLHDATNSFFDGASFYDKHQYLPQLSINAQIVDDEFQKSVVNAMGIDKMTGVGSINLDDEKSEIVQFEYKRGPVKLLERALAKAENDYFSEPYPTSASVLDFNRCSLIFEDIQSLLVALDVFVNKVYGYDCGAIIGIVRAKNGFIDYAIEPQYADVKLNVLIRGGNAINCNLVGEVQFLLRKMTVYKQRAHNLYSIQREKEFVEKSVTILPTLIDRNMQLKVAASSGNVKQLCSLMVFGNMQFKDIRTVNNLTILVPICKSGYVAAFKMVQSMMSEQELFDELFKENKNFVNSIERAIQRNRLNLFKYILDVDGVKEELNSDEYIYRL